MDESRIQHTNQHASSSPFFTGLLMYFVMLSLCHVGDYGLTGESFQTGYASWDVYGDVGVVLGGEPLALGFMTYLVTMLMYSGTFSFTPLAPEGNNAFFRTYAPLGGMRGVTPEYSDALIQHHVTNGLTYVPQIVDQFTEVDGMVEQDKILVYTLGLLLIYLALDEYIWGLWFTNGVVHMEGFWEVAGLEMGTMLTVGLMQDVGTYFVPGPTGVNFSLWNEWASGGLFMPAEGAASDLHTLTTEVGGDYVGALYVDDVCTILLSWTGDVADITVTSVVPGVSQGMDASTFFGPSTTLLGSKVFMLLVGSGLAFLFGTYNWLYVLSTSDDSFMNKELHRIGHFRTEENVWFGFKLFLLSEVLIFAGFFWGLFFYMLVPAVAIGNAGPPVGLPAMDVFSVPLLNTCLLVTSGMAITWGHIALGNLTHLLRGRPFLTEDPQPLA